MKIEQEAVVSVCETVLDLIFNTLGNNLSQLPLRPDTKELDFLQHFWTEFSEKYEDSILGEFVKEKFGMSSKIFSINDKLLETRVNVSIEGISVKATHKSENFPELLASVSASKFRLDMDQFSDYTDKLNFTMGSLFLLNATGEKSQHVSAKFF